MSLQEQLSALKSDSQANRTQDVKTKMSNDLARLSESGLIDGAPKSGDKLEDFTLPNYLGEKKTLSEFREKGPVIITFYRGGWCPYCNLQLRAYQQIIPEIKAQGASLIAITPELPDASLSTVEKNELEFEVLTDTNSDYARKIGIVFTLSKDLRPIYNSFGIEIEKHNGEGRFDLPLAATFVVDADGTIAYAFVEVDYTLRAEPAEIIEAIQTLKRRDKTDQVA